MQSWDTRKSFGGKAQASKSRQSLSIDLSTTALFTFTSARRTKPFLQVRTSITLSRGHVLRGEFSALISSEAMSISVCSGAGADILYIIVSKKCRQDITLVSTCVATKNPPFGIIQGASKVLIAKEANG